VEYGKIEGLMRSMTLSSPQGIAVTVGIVVGLYFLLGGSTEEDYKSKTVLGCDEETQTLQDGIAKKQRLLDDCTTSSSKT
jgi:hypothetical protein